MLLVNSTGSLLVHPFSANVSGVEPSPGFHVASLCRVVGRAENTLMVSLVFLKGAVLVPGLEAGEEDATFDATLAAMCGLAPWCRTLVWLAPNFFQDFFAPRLAGNAGFLVGKKCYQVGFYEGQRKGCGRHKVTGSSKALLLLSVPQVILALWCLAAAISGIFVVLSAQAAASGAYVGILFSKFLFCAAAAALGMSIALVVLYFDCFSGYGIRVAAASVFILVCAAATFLAAAAWPFVGSRSVSVLHGHVLGLWSLVLLLLTSVYMHIVIVGDFLYVVLAFWFAFVGSQQQAAESEDAVMQQHAAAAMKEQQGVCKEVSVNALQAKATARVDVPETSKTQGYGVELEESEKVKKSFLVFLRSLQGRHHVLSCCADMLVADRYELVADTCHMPCERFMLVHQSKIVQRSGSLGEWGIERDVTLTLTFRMLGGSGIPGEWHCALCNRGGCWHTKAWCFRCGTSRAESEAILRGSAQGFALPGKGSAKGKGIGKGVGPQPQREQRYPGRPAPTSGPQFSRAPTFHAPRQNKRKQADSSSPLLNALPQVVEVLKMLGCSQDILDMVKSKVEEQTRAQHQVPGEKERMLHVLKMKLTKAKSHLAHLGLGH